MGKKACKKVPFARHEEFNFRYYITNLEAIQNVLWHLIEVISSLELRYLHFGSNIENLPSLN